MRRSIDFGMDLGTIFGSTWAPFGLHLAPFGAHMGLIWPHLCPNGPHWASVGPLVAAVGPHLGRMWTPLGSIWTPLASIWTPFVPHWAHLGADKAQFEPQSSLLIMSWHVIIHHVMTSCHDLSSSHDMSACHDMSSGHEISSWNDMSSCHHMSSRHGMSTCHVMPYRSLGLAECAQRFNNETVTPNTALARRVAQKRSVRHTAAEWAETIKLPLSGGLLLRHVCSLLVGCKRFVQ